MTGRRLITVAVVAVAVVAVGTGSYLQWWNAPSFEERVDGIRHADFVVNTAFALEDVEADSPAEANERGSSTVRVTFDGPDAVDAYRIVLYARDDDAATAFSRLRTTAADPSLPAGGFFDDNGGFCNHVGSTFTCSALFDDTTVQGIATAAGGDDDEATLDNAQSLLQAAVKNLYQVSLDLEGDSHPFIVSLALAVALLLALGLWRTISSPGVPAPMEG